MDTETILPASGLDLEKITILEYSDADFDGYLFYVIDNTLHLLNTADDPMLMFKTYKCEAIRNYDDEQQKFHSLQSSVQFKCLPLSKD